MSRINSLQALDNKRCVSCTRKKVNEKKLISELYKKLLVKRNKQKKTFGSI